MKRDMDISKEVALIWNTANDVLREFSNELIPDIMHLMVLICRIEGVLIAKTEVLKKQLESGCKKSMQAFYRLHIINHSPEHYGELAQENI